mgnify:FL=1
MDINVSKKYEAVDELYATADIGVASETVLKALDPLIERRLGALLDQFSVCAPELGPLLDLKARISETWRIRKELKMASMRGKKALDSLQAILEVKP